MTIDNYKVIDKGALRASFDLTLGSGMLITGAMLLSKDDRQWVSFPGIPMYKDNQPIMREGKQQYKNLLSIPDRPTRDKFNEQVLTALRTAGHVN